MNAEKTAPRIVDKPWGREVIWAETDQYVGKILEIDAGQSLSLQYHTLKDETIYVLAGSIMLQIGMTESATVQKIFMKVGDSFHITPGTVHRFTAIEPTQLLEASTPHLNDVVRLEDRYGRKTGD